MAISFAPPVAAVERTGPLSLLQEQLWLIEQLAPDGALYNEVRALELRGALDHAALQAALDQLVARHEALRTTVRDTPDGPVQQIWSPAPVALLLDHAPDDDAVAASGRALAEQPYDLARGPLLRCALLERAADRHVLLLAVHHIVLDGESMDIAVRELGTLYEALVDGQPLELPDPGPAQLDFALWQREALADGRLTAEHEYWTEQLEGAPSVLELPTDRPRPRTVSGAGTRARHTLSAGALHGARELAQESGGTLFSAVLGAFGGLLARVSGRDDLIIGTGAHGRPGTRFAGTIGLFANVLPLRLRPCLGDSTAELAEAAADVMFDGLDHQLLPFERIVELVGPARDPSHAPLVQVVLALWDEGPGAVRFGDLDARAVELPRGRARFDLLIEVLPHENTLELRTEHDAALFDDATIARLVGQLDAVLCAATDRPLACIELGGDAAIVGRGGEPVPAGAIGALGDTGWLARRAVDGRIERIGRAQRRVATGGLARQPEPLEALLRDLPSVRAALVDGNDAIVVWDGAPDPDGALAALRAQVPAAVCADRVLSAQVIIRDGDELHAGGVERPAQSHGPTWLEQTLLELWAEVMELDDLTVDDDFFALGGHSVLAAKLARRTGEALGVEVGLALIFEFCTVGELADELSARHPQLTAPACVPEPAAARPITDRQPLSASQLSLWMAEQLGGGDVRDFTAALAYTIRGPLDAAALEQALGVLVARHETLRGVVVMEGVAPVLRIRDDLTVTLPVDDLAPLSEDEREAAAERLIRAEVELPFDTARGPLIRARLIRLDAQEHVLVLAQHHLVTDAVSMEVVGRDLAAAYGRACSGVPEPAFAPAMRYADYVAREERWLAGPQADDARRYWQSSLAGAPTLNLPGRRPGARRAYDTATCSATLAAGAAAQLDGLCRRLRASPFMLATAAYAAALAQWAGSEDIVIGTTVDNRPARAMEDVVGCCVNVVALRIDCGGDPTFAQLAGRVRQAVVGAHQHQALPFGQVVAALGSAPDPDRTPVFQVTADWVDQRQIALALEGCEVAAAPVPLKTLRYELGLYASRVAGGLELDLEYGLDLWDATAIAQQLTRVCALLAGGVAQPDVPLSQLTTDKEAVA